jgi:hypothetical protein
MIIEFGIDHTNKGCTAWMQTPTRTERKHFRNTYVGSALVKATDWINEEHDRYIAFAKELGKPAPEMIVPDGILRDRVTKRITLSVKLWAALEGKDISAILSEALGLTD